MASVTGFLAAVFGALATTAFLDAATLATGFGATFTGAFVFEADLAFAADLATGLATGFFSALRATEAVLGAALDGFDFAGAFLDFEAVLAMVHNQSAGGNDRGKVPRYTTFQ
jgi:hypothetical protein